MKSPFLFLFWLIFFMASCEGDERPFTGVRAKIAGNAWVADEVVIETASSDPLLVTRLRAIENGGFQIVFSFKKLGITTSTTSVQFRERTAQLNYFSYSIVSVNEFLLKWQTESE
jgi:hypothetical protein